MSKRRRAEAVAGADPKHLRRKQRRADAKLAKALTKRDVAQARVDALNIIVDEICAQLAECEKARGGEPTAEATEPTASAASVGVRR